jgi:hypothetical protein
MNLENQTKTKKETLTPSLLASLKLIIIEQFLTTTAHALPNIFRTGNIILKIIWLFAFLACGSYCVASVVKTFTEYLTFPTYTSTEIIKEVSTKFPAVTICNLKTINTTRSSSYFKAFYEFNYENYMMPFEYIISQQYIIRSIVNNDKYFTYESRKKIGFELKDMLISCYFNYQPCDVNDFTYIYDPLLGNCYTFNKGVHDNGSTNSIKKVSVAGTLYGLILELYLGDPKVDTINELNDGVVISIHNQSTKPFTQGDKIKAAAGAETDLIVSRNFISKLEFPYGTCLKDTTISSKFSSFYFDYIVRIIGETYSHQYCYDLCFQKAIMNKCNCTNTFMPTFNGSNDICFEDKIYCMQNIVNGFGETPDASDCHLYCPFECDSIDYIISSYKSLYPNEFYSSILYDKLKFNGINVSRDNIDKAFSKVNIFYKNMEYNLITQKIQTSFEDLWSNIGGTLGLYVGISILSVVEVVELGFNLILAIIDFMKSKKQVKMTVVETFT